MKTRITTALGGIDRSKTASEMARALRARGYVVGRAERDELMRVAAARSARRVRATPTVRQWLRGRLIASLRARPIGREGTGTPVVAVPRGASRGGHDGHTSGSNRWRSWGSTITRYDAPMDARDLLIARFGVRTDIGNVSATSYRGRSILVAPKNGYDHARRIVDAVVVGGSLFVTRAAADEWQATHRSWRLVAGVPTSIPPGSTLPCWGWQRSRVLGVDLIEHAYLLTDDDGMIIHGHDPAHARGLLAARRATRDAARAQALADLSAAALSAIATIAAIDVGTATLADSRDAGNCDAGTNAWRDALGVADLDRAELAALAQLADWDACPQRERVGAVVRAAISRTIKEACAT